MDGPRRRGPHLWKLLLSATLAPTLQLLTIAMTPAKFVGLALVGKDIVFRFITEYSSLRDFGPQVIIGLFLYEDF